MTCSLFPTLQSFYQLQWCLYDLFTVSLRNPYDPNATSSRPLCGFLPILWLFLHRLSKPFYPPITISLKSMYDLCIVFLSSFFWPLSIPLQSLRHFVIVLRSFKTSSHSLFMYLNLCTLWPVGVLWLWYYHGNQFWQAVVSENRTPLPSNEDQLLFLP